MAIPSFQAIMLPLLKSAGDGRDHALREAVNAMAEQFGLTEQDRNVTLTCGRPVFRNRVGWALAYLKKAGLLRSTGRGVFCITPRGLKVLGSNPTEIDRRFLEQFQEFREFIGTSHRDSKPETNEKIAGQTPEEALAANYQYLRKNLAEDLLERVKSCSPGFFERLVVDLLVAMGYGGSREDAGQAIGRTGDGGIDGIIKEDKLGLDIIYVQAKRWNGVVGRPEVQAFAGSLEGRRARKGVFITTSQFSSEAKDYVERIEKKIVLIDGHQLAELMIDHNVGVAPAETYVINEVDQDYFQEE